MDTLPGWIATAPHWLQAVALLVFALPAGSVIGGALGGLFKSRAEARAIDGSTVSQGWGAVITELRADLERKDAEIDRLTEDRNRGWNLHRGDYELLRKTIHAWRNAETSQNLRLDLAAKALEQPDPLPELRRMLSAWPRMHGPPDPPMPDDVRPIAPEQFRYAQDPKEGKP